MQHDSRKEATLADPSTLDVRRGPSVYFWLCRSGITTPE